MRRSPLSGLAPVLVGAFLLLLYVLLAALQPYQATAGRSFLFISADELRFWLAHWMLAAPGLVLIAVAHRGRDPEHLWAWALSLTSRGWSRMALLYFIVLTILAVVGRHVFLLDLPITDDENLVAFGAAMFLNGDVSVPILEPEGAFTQVFTYRHNGYVSAIAYPGALLFRALSIVSGLGPVLYAFAAAGTGLAVVASARVLFGREGAVIAAGWWLCSPMAFTLAMTTHSHLVSRFFLAVSIWVYLRVVTHSSPRPWHGTSLALVAGLAFLTRSPEAACILLPLAAHLIVVAVRDARLRRTVYAAVGTSALVLGLYAWYNVETTGIWYLQARFGPGVHLLTDNPDGNPLTRLAYNLGHNVLLLSVMALGPLGALFCALGRDRRAPIVVLAAGVLLEIGLTLLYDDTGIHTVGPIHFSETLPGLVLLATGGVLAVVRLLRRHEFPMQIPHRAIGAYMLGGLLLFSFVHSLGLRSQAENSRLIYDAVAAAQLSNAVVIADPPQVFIHSHPVLRRSGSWVHWFPPPDPYFRDDVLYAYSSADVNALRRKFPDRRFYLMTYHHGDPPVRIAALE